MFATEQGITENNGWKDGQERQPTNSAAFSRQSSKLVVSGELSFHMQ